MSTIYFGITRGRVRSAAAQRIATIARRYDCEFICHPFGQPIAFFSAPKLDSDQLNHNRTNAVWRALKRTGLANDRDLMDDCFDFR
jgi:hypothetical protein